MRICPSCGKEQQDDAVICTECGAKLEGVESEQEIATSKDLSAEAEITEATESKIESEFNEEPVGIPHSVEQTASGDTSNEAAETNEAKTDHGGETIGITAVVEQESSEDVPVETAETESSVTENEPDRESADITDAGGGESDESASDTQAGDTTETSQPVQPAQEETKSKKSSRNWIIGIIIVLVVVVVVIVAIVLLVMANSDNGGVSEDQVRDNFEESTYYENGIVPSVNVGESDYKLVKFSEDGQQDDTVTIDDAEQSARRVDFSGTMENDYFTTEFTGHAYYSKSGDSWDFEQTPGIEIDDSTTTPLKGVDQYRVVSQSDSDQGTLGEPEITFGEKDGVYTTTISQDATYDFWFATDHGTYTTTYTFDNDKGWASDGEAVLTDQTTTWKLAGKTYDVVPGTSPSASDGTVTSSITFSEFDSDNVVAEYTIHYVPSSADNEGGSGEFYEVNLAGSAESTESIGHKFGLGTFSFNMDDSEQDVTFNCLQGSVTEVEGQETVGALTVSLNTGVNYRTAFFNSTNHEYSFALSYVTYEEETSAAS